MTASPLDLLTEIARMPPGERQEQRQELKSRLEPELPTMLQRHVLACLLGEPCPSAAARAWAAALVAESAEA